MLGFGDQISESIAHFIGYFHTSIEAARARFEYREFKATPAKEPHFNDILTIQTNPTQQLNPGSFQTGYELRSARGRRLVSRPCHGSISIPD